jgi:cation transport regulator ChaC
MDAHYYQVMDKRSKVTSNGCRNYFAYSTILDQEAFKEWAEQHSYQFFKLPEGKIACLPDTELVFDFPSRWWGGRVGSLGDQAGSKVYGVLFQIPEKDWPIVQHKEGVITGMCVEADVTVQIDDLQVEATAFVTNPSRASTEGSVSAGYLEAIISGATQSGLPHDYIEYLKQLLTKV